MLRAFALLFAVLTVAAAPVRAAEADVAYKGDAYTVYREEPGYCTLYYDFADNGMVRFSYRDSTGDIFFSLVRDNFPQLPDEDLPVTFAFDDSNVWLAFPGTPYDLAKFFEDETRRGVSLKGDMRLLNKWAASRKVAVIFGVFGMYPAETLDISGGSKAVSALKRCVKKDQAAADGS